MSWPFSGRTQEMRTVEAAIAGSDVSGAVTSAVLWEPPPVDVLIIATSSRFTADAVQWIERHNHERSRPTIELWPDTHLEALLARRAPLVAEFGLRAPN